jgi:hypothetical protein
MGFARAKGKQAYLVILRDLSGELLHPGLDLLRCEENLLDIISPALRGWWW